MCGRSVPHHFTALPFQLSYLRSNQPGETEAALARDTRYGDFTATSDWKELCLHCDSGIDTGPKNLWKVINSHQPCCEVQNSWEPWAYAVLLDNFFQENAETELCPQCLFVCWNPFEQPLAPFV